MARMGLPVQNYELIELRVNKGTHERGEPPRIRFAVEQQVGTRAMHLDTKRKVANRKKQRLAQRDQCGPR